MMKEVKVSFHPDGVSVLVPVGTDLLTAALKAGLFLSSSCGGKGVCGRCRIKVIRGDIEGESTGKISPEEKKAGICLACRTLVRGDVEVEILPQTRVSARPQVEILERKQGEEAEKVFSLSTFPLLPLTRKFVISVSSSAVGRQPGSDFGRMESFLKTYDINHLSVSLSTLRYLPLVLQENKNTITVTVAEKEGVEEAILIESGDTSLSHFGVAVDIGTTTVSASLFHLGTGELLGTEMAFNRQISFGEDIISRIILAEKSEGLEKLHHAVVDTVNELVKALIESCGVNLTDVLAMACSGNMTMIHLLLKINPSFLRREPYIPTSNFFPVINAAEVGIRINPAGILATVGGVSSYVGGDITAGVLATGLATKSSLALLVDIGTNGEMVLGNKNWLLCCSASAGPAFEGSGVKDGMRAVPGAIDSVEIIQEGGKEKVLVETIGGKPPVGICGSGYMALMAALFKHGIIDRAGRFTEKSGRICGNSEEKAYLVVEPEFSGHGQPIVLTQLDIENLLRAKAAVFAGLACLIRRAGVSLNDIETIYIGGGFGTRMNTRSAIEIGLLPDLPENRFRFVGNTSLQGACYFLLSRYARQLSREIVNLMTPLELSLDSGYMEEYLRALFIPHTDLNLFPSLRK